MKHPKEWRNEFNLRMATAVGSGISYDVGKIIEELSEDIQNDALNKEPVKRIKYGIVSRLEAEENARLQSETK